LTVALWLLPRVSGNGDPSRWNPAPLTTTWLIVTLDGEALRMFSPITLLLPTTTVPKSRFRLLKTKVWLGFSARLVASSAPQPNIGIRARAITTACQRALRYVTEGPLFSRRAHARRGICPPGPRQCPDRGSRSRPRRMHLKAVCLMSFRRGRYRKGRAPVAEGQCPIPADQITQCY
jgi:hypothetical protein